MSKLDFCSWSELDLRNFPQIDARMRYILPTSAPKKRHSDRWILAESTCKRDERWVCMEQSTGRLTGEIYKGWRSWVRFDGIPNPNPIPSINTPPIKNLIQNQTNPFLKNYTKTLSFKYFPSKTTKVYKTTKSTKTTKTPPNENPTTHYINPQTMHPTLLPLLLTTLLLLLLLPSIHACTTCPHPGTFTGSLYAYTNPESAYCGLPSSPPKPFNNPSNPSSPIYASISASFFDPPDQAPCNAPIVVRNPGTGKNVTAIVVTRDEGCREGDVFLTGEGFGSLMEVRGGRAGATGVEWEFGGYGVGY